ncbi:MAG: hypothetical protein IJ587_05025 [Synergistaceae bacterium]|nr:hypothetical protein [Synergistaceae bacterium]
MRLETETKIKELSPIERKVLVYVQSGNNCGVWVAQKDAAVQTLIHKGLLEQLGEVRQFDDWNGERVFCILVVLSPYLKEYNDGKIL